MEQKTCKNHDQVEAKWKCEICQGYFCDECIKVSQITGLDIQTCKGCGGKCDLLSKVESVQSQVSPAASFFDQLPSVFAYPFVRGGLSRFIIGVIFFSFLNFIASFSIFGFATALFVAGYIIAWFIGIIHSTANGEDDLAAWPEFRDFWSDIIHPYLLFMLTAFLCRLPALLSYFGLLYLAGVSSSIFSLFAVFINPFAAAYAFLPLYGIILVALLEILGAIYFPMGILAVALYGTVGALHPRVVVPSIFKALGPYTIVCFLFMVIGMMNALSSFFGVILPVIGLLMTYPFTFYLIIVQARILGLIYRTHAEKLDWFQFTTAE
ncbi:MAG: hypothetical protein JW734_04365 [Candidatus Omnitrophica bacterium]|nr:hypothetical protein [Candidatus Omnitrophota bacterium]